MNPFSCTIDDHEWRVTRISAHNEFKVEQHTRGVGYATIMESATVSEDDTLIHDNSLDAEVIQCIEAAIGAYLEHEETLDGFIPIKITHRSRCVDALEMILRYGGIDGGHHKQWVLDQVVRILTDENYENFVIWANDGEDGPETYNWDEGCPP